MHKRHLNLIFVGVIALVLGAHIGSRGADHREAPMASETPTGDMTDVFVFRDPNNPSRLVLAMAVNPLSVPSRTLSYGFSQEFLYQLKIDNDGDGREDAVIQAMFEGIGIEQTVRLFGPERPQDQGDLNRLLPGEPAVEGPTGIVLGDSDGLQLFAGLRDDTFVNDAGQVFRITTNLQDVFREVADSLLGPLRGRPVRADQTSGVDGTGGFNASHIIVAFPAALVRGASSRLNVWGTVSRPSGKAFLQFERMGQGIFALFIPPLLNDTFNASVPADDVAQWSAIVPDALTTEDNDGTGNTIAGRAGLLETLGFTTLPNGAPLLLPPDMANQDPDLLRMLLLPDVVRIDLDLAPDDLAIGHFGITNGRRPGNDVTDLTFHLTRQLADFNFPPELSLPGSGPPRPGAWTFPEERRIFLVLQGTDFIEPDEAIPDVSSGGNDRMLLDSFPFFPEPHPFPGEPGTVGFPPQQ